MGFEYRCYAKHEKWTLLAGFHVEEHANWFTLYYINKNQDKSGYHPEVKIMKGKENWKSFKFE